MVTGSIGNHHAFDLGPMGIRINGIAPGTTRTAALESVLNDEIEKTMLMHTPIHRLGEPQDMANAARGVHGQTLYIDPRADMVIVRFASTPTAANAANDPTSLPAYQAVADYLMTHDRTPGLVGHKWIIEDIAGRGVIDNSPASLRFLANGRLAGNASCNRLIGSYTRKDHKLSIEPTGTTMMACPKALMNQERRLLKMLPDITRYRIDDTGTLVLETADGTSITAHRR